MNRFCFMCFFEKMCKGSVRKAAGKFADKEERLIAPQVIPVQAISLIFAACTLRSFRSTILHTIYQTIE